MNNDFAKTSHNALFVAHFVRPNASHIINIEIDQAKFAHHRQTHAYPTLSCAHSTARPPAIGCPAIHCEVVRTGLKRYARMESKFKTTSLIQYPGSGYSKIFYNISLRKNFISYLDIYIIIINEQFVNNVGLIDFVRPKKTMD